ncbi:MAG TPA: ATP-binding protein [Gaiellaceae bacterium]|nr:ATP-binding protein [Gaiellaceae bacterium]
MTSAAADAAAPVEAEPRQVDAGLLARRRTRLALATMLVLVLGLAAIAFLATGRLYRSAQDRYVKEAFPLRAAAHDLLADMLDEETGVRGYVITADPSSLQPYTAARPRAAADLADLARLTERRPEIRTQVQTVRQIVFELNGYFDRQVSLVRSGRAGQLTAQANVLQGTSRFDRFRATANALGSDADRIVAGAKRSQRRTLWSTLAIVLALGGAAAAIGVFLLLRLPRLVEGLYRSEQDARRRAERGDRASRSLAHVAEAVVLLDADGVVRYWNPAAERSFGVAEDAALNAPVTRSLPELATIEGDLGGRSAASLRLERDGDARRFAVNESRFPEGRVLVLRDVTDEHRLERVRADFVATASHELRTPLAAVYGAVRTLLRPDRVSNAELDGRLLTMIEQESERLRGIVEQILVSSQLDRGEMRVAAQRCDVRELGESVLASMQVRTSSKHTFALRAPGEVFVKADPERLRQVLVNLLDNALKYAPDGGLIEVDVHERGDAVAIEVADQGIGIPPDAQARVFEKFFRLDPDMRLGVGGSGLGLYISRELVREMGGELAVRSRPDGGSVFTVELPRA